MADFTGTPLTGTAPLTVDYTNLSTNYDSQNWTFGDGGTSTEQNPSHTYTEPGSYTVSLQALGDGGTDTETKTNYVTVSGAAPRLSISGADFIDVNGDVWVPYGMSDGHFELWKSGDEAADAAKGATCLREVVRIYGTYGTGYQQDMQDEGQPGDLDPTYLANIVTRITAAKAAGLYVGIAMDSDKGQGAEDSGGESYFGGTEGQRKWGIHIGTAEYLAENHGDKIDWMEPLVEPNSAVVASKEILWAKQEEFMTAILAVAPHMLFAIGPRDYSAGNIPNAINPDWLLPTSPFYQHVFMTCNFLDNLSMDAAQRTARAALVASTRNSQVVPAWINQIATHNSNDPDNSNLDATMTLLDQSAGGYIGYCYWERMSMAGTADGLYYLSDTGDPNSSRLSHDARIAVVSAHFNHTTGTQTWLGRRLLATNMGPRYDFATRVYVNLLHQMRAFGTLADSYVNVPLKADGYPQAGQTCICYFLTRMDASEAGEYLFECIGDETDLTNASDGPLTNLSFNAGTNKTTWKITITGAAGALGVRFNNVGPNFGGLKAYPPGYPLDTTAVYRSDALHHFGMFRQIRFMDWQETNGPETGGGGNQDTDWATSRAANWNSAVGYKGSLKACFDFCAAIDADPYTNVPAKFTDAAILSYVQDGLSRLPAGRVWYIEAPANEPWNGDFVQYHDLRTAAFTQGKVKAGTDLTLTRTLGTTVTATVGAGHGKIVGDSIYVRHKTNAFAAGVQTVTAVTSTTVSWASAGTNGAINPIDDNTFIYLDIGNELVAPVTTYYVPDQWPIATQVKGRYELTRAHRVAECAAGLGASDRVRVIYGVWMDNYFNSIENIAWAAEKYGDMDWLYAMTPALYLRPDNPAACTTVDQVFTQLEAARTAILPRAHLWGNLMRSWGMHLVAYEGLEHTHDFGGHTAIFVSAHQDDRMRVLNKNLLQDWLDRGGEGMYAFFSGWRREMLSGTDSWVDVVGDFSTGDTQAKHQAWVELKDEACVAQPLSGKTSGTINYVDVIANGYQGVANGQLVIRPTHKILPTTIVFTVPSDGSYTVAIDAGTDTATVIASMLIDGVVQDSGSLPTVASVFSGSHPGEALSATLNLTAGLHTVSIQLPAPTRAGWVALYRVRIS